MSASQEHGLHVERLIKDEILRRNSFAAATHLKVEPGHTARFDVPGYMDPYKQGIPTSIKACKNKKGTALVCLADATRIADLASYDKTRMLIALYDQVGADKVFREVREYIITGQEWSILMGGVPPEEIDSFNQALKQPVATVARAAAKAWKARLNEEYPGQMRWNAKIDSKGQRRLQCSLPLSEIEAVIADKRRIKVFGSPKDMPGQVRPAYLRPVSRHMWKDGFRFPFKISSPPRKRHPKPVIDVVDAVSISAPPVRIPSRRMK